MSCTPKDGRWVCEENMLLSIGVILGPSEVKVCTGVIVKLLILNVKLNHKTMGS